MFGTASSCGKFLSINFFFLSSVFMFGCSQEDKANSGDCYYETVETLAEVIDMRPHPDGNGKISIILDFKASVLALENQELGNLKGYQIDDKFLKRNHIDMGNKYSVTVSELTKGNCDTKLTVAFDHGFQ
jgi:hypothetical protein